MLTYFKPIDRIDQWEGGAYLYQGGYLEIVQKIARRCKEDFAEWGVKTIVPLLDAVEYLFNQVHPNEMGIKHDQTFLNFNQWLVDKIKSEELKLTHRLKLKVTIHDNCYSKAVGDAYWQPPRVLIKRCGCEIVEMKHIKKDALCCGFGAGASWVQNSAIPFDIITQGMKKFQEAEETGADALVTYCTGCLYLLWATRELSGSKIDVYHVIELIRMAMGEKLNYPKDHIKRAWDVIAIITYQMIVSLLQKNFFIRKITYDEHLSTFKPGKHRLLKIIRLLFKNSLVRKIYARFFRLMAPIRT